MTSTDIVLEFKSVQKKFGRHLALDNLSMQIRKGTVCGLVGSNGAGKTTSFAVAMGLLLPDRGSVDVLGEGPFDPISHAGKVSMMPQDAELPKYARVRDVLAFYARLQGIPGEQIRDEVEKVIEWVNLGERANALIRTLSHGMRRRVVVAQAFLGSPGIVMLDEPMGGLDPREVVNIRQLLVRKDPEQTIVISSHNLHELELVCDEVVFIDHGKLVRHESMADILGHEETVHFILAATPDFSVAALQQQLPHVQMNWMPDDGVLVCHDTTDERSVAQLNEIVLKHLFEQQVGILEVRRGRNLETAYITHSVRDPAPPATSANYRVTTP